ncbi:M48 family metallopeptidase [Limnohabitans sp. 103DPR2]|uniref:M48 family metallopeptidase n=1 Tax=Limnohabitans sp. 103DPR2 TaxID=1678129 RepID=UPI0006DC16AE|nr:M48 family metallopeptidase [Limnohabitans sp. 103DPR2]ALK92979.1 Protease HtpX [Limnohabitans sp. 103DPR2]
MSFDVQAATDNYINALGPEALAKATAYTSGSHWTMLWGFLISTAVAWLVIKLKVLDKIEGKLSHRSLWFRSFAISAAYLVLSSLLVLPWTLYADWWRELAYGKTNQPLSDFLSQGFVMLIISSLFGGLFLSGIYFCIRRLGTYWWAWSGGVAAVAVTSMMLIGPIWIEPLFNKYTPLPQGEVREALEVLAKQANIQPDRIFVYDGSRQSNRFTANVSGLGSSARIAISDVALTSASLDEVKAVTGHEIGHYVSDHIWNLIGTAVLMSMIFFYLSNAMFMKVANLMGAKASIAEPRGVAVLLVCISFLSLLAQPVTNYVIRLGETEADQYSYKAVNLPDAMASALVKTAEYRDPRPHPLQELIFYTHPSVEKRVKAAMEWKAQHSN